MRASEALYKNTAFVKKAGNGTRLDHEFSKWDGDSGWWKTPGHL